MKEATGKPVGLIMANGDIQAFSDEDHEAAEVATHSERYSFVDPLRTGEMKWVEALSQQIVQGEECRVQEDLADKLDWIGVNYYSRSVVRKSGQGYRVLGGYGYSATAGMRSKGGREVSDSGWEVYPEGF